MNLYVVIQILFFYRYLTANLLGPVTGAAYGIPRKAIIGVRVSATILICENERKIILSRITRFLQQNCILHVVVVRTLLRLLHTRVPI